MGFDAIFKRYFLAVVCLLVGVAAYFQASGMGQLVASSVALDPSSIPSAAPAPARVVAAPASTDHTTTAGAILARNPFDSVTGPLDGKKIELPDPTPQEDTNRDPYDDPDCDAAKALLIVASDDPQWSFAALAGPDGKSVLRRVGDEINGHTIQFIGDQRTDEQKKNGKREIFDRVWLAGGSGGRCQIRVGGKAPVKQAAAAPAAETPAPAGKKKGGKVPSEIADKIHKVSETEFNVERSVVDQILENQAELMKSARIVPEKEGDKIVGIRLFGIRQESLLGMLGLENGDRLSSINGFEMSDPQKALEAYSKLRTADHLTVAVNRHGKPVNIDFNIK
ncbi:General secretion pathway protein C [Minicystis rosea]|nr:General secretion pathway protein C [Minicystis rosea]